MSNASYHYNGNVVCPENSFLRWQHCPSLWLKYSFKVNKFFQKTRFLPTPGFFFQIVHLLKLIVKYFRNTVYSNLSTKWNAAIWASICNCSDSWCWRVESWLWRVTVRFVQTSLLVYKPSISTPQNHIHQAKNLQGQRS